MSYTIPNVVSQHPRGDRIMDVYSHLLTERVVYLGTAHRRGRRQRAHRAAAAPGCRQPRPRHPAVHQLGGRRSERDARDLRHDAARAPRCRDDLRRSGDRRRRRHARVGRRRQARGAAARAGGAAPAQRAGSRGDPRPDPAGRRARARARRGRASALPTHRTGCRQAARSTPTATASSPPTRRSPTDWWTGC